MLKKLEQEWKAFTHNVTQTGKCVCNDVTNSWLDDKLPLAGF